MPILYDAPNPAPNPRRVRIFIAEKGLSVETRQLSIVGGEHKQESYTAKYPPGQVPSLELDDGRVIGESVSICRYLEAHHPAPSLFGRDPLSIAQIDMWIRRIEFTLMMPVGQVWMHTHPFTARVVKPQYGEFGESNRPKAVAAMRIMDKALASSPFIAGESFSMADIVLLTTVDFARFVGIEMPGNLEALADWHARVSARPSASA